MLLRTLGRLELEPVHYPQAKPLLLLAYLSLQGPQPRRHVATLFWPRATDPLNRLSVTLYRLRKAVPDSADADAWRVWTRVQTDAVLVTEALASGRFEQACDLYRGHFLESAYVSGLGEELREWIDGTRDELAGRIQRAGLREATALAADGRFELAGARAEQAYGLVGSATLDPDDLELLHALLAACGSPKTGAVRGDAAALNLSLAPSRKEARSRLLADAPMRPVPNNLRLRATGFVGRTTELGQIAEMLACPDRRLLTLVGPGGIGKSRLALQAASERLELPNIDGVYFVALETVATVAEIPRSIADVLGLGLPASGDPLEALVHGVANRRLLLVLDNFEHLIEGALMVATLVGRCPGLTLLVTSRERLGLEEEWPIPLDGLPCPDVDGMRLADDGAWPAGSEATELFGMRAQRAEPGFRLRPQDLPHVVRICRSTRGSPLALELAAVWVGVMSVADIAAEIAGNLDFLVTSTRDVAPRHRSLRAVFEHSWRLLAPPEQTCLRKLAVFQGGFDRDGASFVADARTPVLASLVRKSLILRLPLGRYEQHPMLRQYCREELAKRPQDESDARAKHASFMLASAEAAAPHINGDDGVSWLERLEAEHADLRAALLWAECEARIDVLARLCHALIDFWIRRGHHTEAVRWFTALLERGDARVDERRYARSLQRLAYLCLLRADFATPRRLLPLSLAIFRRQGDAAGEALALSSLGMLAVYQCDYVTAESRYRSGLRVARAANDALSLGRLLNNLGDALAFQGDHLAARACYDECLTLQRHQGDRQMESNVLGSLGMTALHRGAAAEAQGLFRESLELVRSLGITFSVAPALEQFACLATVEGRPLDAARLWGAAEALRASIDTPLEAFARQQQQTYVARARAMSSAAGLAEEWAIGRGLTTDAAIDLALTVRPSSVSADLPLRPGRSAATSGRRASQSKGPA